MLWKCQWNLPNIKRKTLILNALFFSSIPKVRAFGETHEFSRVSVHPNDVFPCKTKLQLNPEIVHSTLQSCPSDLIALSFFMWCAKQTNYFHDTKAFDHMVGVVEKLTGRYKTVREIFRELESVGCVLKPQTFLLLLRIYWRGGMFHKVFDAYEEMCNFGYVPNTLARNVIMDVLFKVGRADIAIGVLRETESPNFLSFNIALCNLCKLNDLVKIKEVLRVMLRKGFYPNTNTFEMILNGYCKMGQLSEAYQVLGLMICLGTSVSVNVWNMLVNGLFHQGELSRAANLVNTMSEIGCAPNIVTYTTLIKGFMESGNVNSAFNIFNTVKSEGIAPDLVLSNVLIDLFTKMGKFDDALDVFLGLLERQLVPDQYSFSSIVSNICLSGRFSLLPKIAKEIGIEADLVVCNSLINYFCKAGYPSFSVKLYSYMIDRGFTPDNYSFVGLLCALCGEGRVNEALNVYQGMVIIYPGLDAHVHTAIINGLIKSGKYHKAIDLFRKSVMEKYPLDVISYTVAIQGLVHAGRTGEAYSLYSQMKEVGVSPNAQTYKIIIYGFCRERDIKMVDQLLKESSKERIELDSNTLTMIHKVLFKSFPRSSDVIHFVDTENSRLMSNEVMNTPYLDAFDAVAKAGKDDSFTESDDHFADSCSSDDFPDVAASAG